MLFYVVSRNDLGWGCADNEADARKNALSYVPSFVTEEERKKATEFVAVFQNKSDFAGVSDINGSIHWNKDATPVSLYKIENGERTDETEFWLNINKTGENK